jgi:hypothetical protein
MDTDSGLAVLSGSWTVGHGSITVFVDNHQWPLTTTSDHKLKYKCC